jgi:lysozyme
MITDKLIDLMIHWEDLALKPYTDTVGKLSIGIGRNLSDNGISRSEALQMLRNDIEGWVIPSLNEIFPDFDDYSENRQNGLISMMFNMGVNRLLGFRNMIAAIKARDWDLAAQEALNSKWAIQVGNRAKEIANMLKAG